MPGTECHHLGKYADNYCAECGGARVDAIERTVPRPRISGGVKGYSDGFEYGRMVGAAMMPERRRDNDRFVAGSEYVRRDSVTRAYWLGFRRAMRSSS